MEMLKNFLCISFLVFGFLLLVHAQDQSGFISLDCGLPRNSNYSEPGTKINYISDADFIDTGSSESIKPEYKANLQQQAAYVRSFPEGIRNCYTINVTSGTKYLIRSSFLYGDYDGLNKLPQFDLHFGPNYWETIKFDEVTSSTIKEIVHVPLMDYVHICLVNTGKGTPFISALELRPLTNSSYASSGSLALYFRLDTGSVSNSSYRYPYDIFDRLWLPYSYSKWTQITTNATIDSGSHNSYQPASIVMNTAATPIDATAPMEFYWVPSDPSLEFFVYMHFAELHKMKANESRAFNINCNGKLLYGPLSPDYLYTTTIFTPTSLTAENFTFSLVQLDNSTLPPILNGLEVYTLIDFSQSETEKDDVDAITNIKSTYGVNKNWQGDPCAPVSYVWAGLNCSYRGLDPPRIISLNLSSSGLTGDIAPYISSLTMLQTLDLSNNNLSGSIPEFLSQMPNLKFLNLENNKLNSSVPAKLIEKSNAGSLSLGMGGNPDLCQSSSCKKKKSNNVLVPVLASVGGVVVVVVLLVAGAILFIPKRKRNQVEAGKINAESGHPNDSFESRKRQYTYSEVLKMTSNFERVLGKGGFGMVYHGVLTDGTEVAVKMLSPSSVQGYQQFQAEVKLLLRVHHRNLTNLVGYCNEGTNMALIYEYLSNGDLHSHLSDNSEVNVLSWEGRLKIALDSAQGLEYLHHGCKPPIVHRDVKTTNILLTDNFQAKIADFGLSRCFPTDGGTHVSTVVAGTPGYLDPEYSITNRLHEKSDVYSFGVVLLEMITGRPAIVRGHEKPHISQWVSSILSNGDIRNVVDQRLRGDYEVNSVWKAVEVAMACVSPTSAKRPNMNQVVTEIQDCLATELSRKNESLVTDSATSIETFSITGTTELSPLAR
ncbi:LRR receptor-like serine/threonine-protein kinase IOS1 [Ziziphus jujuba]|uniref:non-specific serine/threonine protein kinase n=1 Tax=Ziziphus jujuba TaxID=326968 RepID=A0ABM4A763_ZIZJJ|nr:LRR receptor-like serine/threonine-protein kinase IOS1 [Ziziphus jujuba]